MPGSPIVELPRAGLKTATGEIPLEGVAVTAEVNDVAARVTITQRYRNRESTAIEAMYVFPMDELAAVCGFDAIVDGRVFKGIVEEKEKAFKRYDDALADGHGAYLLDEEQADVFTASVGNVPPGGEVGIRITYVTELALEGDALRFVLPTTVSPRYAPAEDHVGPGRTPAEALNPPHMFDVPYGLTFSMRLDMSGAITRVESPSHPISVMLAGASGTVALTQTSTPMDRDVIVLIEAERLHEPHVRVERDPGGRLTAAVIARPSFQTSQAKSEVIFLVDRSGSMQGSSIAEVRNALQLCLRSLTAGCRFNIIGFGSTTESLFTESRPYDDAALEAATAHVDSLDANLGGTEILPALQQAFAQKPIEGLVRQIVVLTDGDITYPDQVMALVGSHAATTRVFAFGIGRGVSAHLVRGMTRAGNGAAEFILPGSRIEPPVLRQLARVLAPAVTQLTIDWSAIGGTPALSRTPPVFSGSRLVSYAFLKTMPSGTMTIAGRSNAAPFSMSAPVGSDADSGRQMLGTLAARARIRELEEDPERLARRGSRQADRTRDRAADEIIALATTYSLLSRETSFVAVEERENAAPGEIALRKVPIAVRSGFGGFDRNPAHLGASRVSGAGGPPPRTSMVASLSYDIGDIHEGSAGFALDDLEDGDTPDPAPPAALLRSAGRIVPRQRTTLIDKLHRLGGGDPPSPTEPITPGPRGASDALRPLDRVIRCQRADGSWELTSTFAAAVGVDLYELTRAMPGGLRDGQRELVWATCVALAWLAARAADQRDEWTLLARKAEAWLASTSEATAVAVHRRSADAFISGSRPSPAP